MLNNKNFKDQNKEDIIKISNITLSRTGEYYQLIKNNDIILDYIQHVFMISDNHFFIYNTNSEKWSCFKLIKDNFEKLYDSEFLILHYPNLLLKLKNKNFHIFSGGFDHNDSLTSKNLLFLAENFLINNGFLLATNMKQYRIFKYDLIKKTYSSEIIKSEKNRLVTKKCIIYFDGIGGIEIYDQNKKIIYSCQKFYKLLNNLYVLKNKEKYIVYDIESKKSIFSGSVLSYMENLITIINYNTDEIMVLDRTNKTIKTYSWNMYKKGEIKTYLKTYNYYK